MKKIKVYVASPCFNKEEKEKLEMYEKYWAKYENYEFYFPFKQKVPNAWKYTESQWAKRVFKADIKAIKKCKEVWVLNYGLYSDSGTAWEAGYAYGLGKKVKNFLVNKEEDIYSLMLINGSSEIIDFGCLYKQK